MRAGSARGASRRATGPRSGPSRSSRATPERYPPDRGPRSLAPMKAADLGPVPDSEKTQSPVDLFLIVAGANLVATTLQTGASLAPAFGLRQAALLAGA